MGRYLQVNYLCIVAVSRTRLCLQMHALGYLGRCYVLRTKVQVITLPGETQIQHLNLPRYLEKRNMAVPGRRLSSYSVPAS